MSTSPIEKPLHWVGAAKKELLALPGEVIDDMGYALGAVQLGAMPPQAKPVTQRYSHSAKRH